MKISGIENKLTDLYSTISTGKRINSAKDDAAGLAISNRMESQIRSNRATQGNIIGDQSKLSVASGSFRQISGALQDMRALAVQAGNGSLNSTDRQMLQDQFADTLSGINGIVSSSTYNNQGLVSGLGDSNMDISSPDGAGRALESLDRTLQSISSQEGQVGAESATLDSQYNAAENEAISMAAAESRISDADLAKQTSEIKKYEVLQKTETFALKNKLDQDKSKLSLLA